MYSCCQHCVFSPCCVSCIVPQYVFVEKNCTHVNWKVNPTTNHKNYYAHFQASVSQAQKLEMCCSQRGCLLWVLIHSSLATLTAQFRRTPQKYSKGHTRHDKAHLICSWLCAQMIHIHVNRKILRQEIQDNWGRWPKHICFSSSQWN